ncbi:hypothetical protein AKJ49_02155 [candidate division MSBL1 archaeon SCGC-AAA382A03]|uniref:Uncharacterized protein n=1 Tax=candidate division MSBL1 archaeon SCGC-AAA382A03 TaxID=1698278 RepID=A0A133VD93_9EURY|nr:hypothetical protein AKJ49_02155 [candidate division MSBL1 archaeon SCGC-AAA382A03]
MFTQGEYIAYKEIEEPSRIGVRWNRGYEPIPIGINKKLVKDVYEFLGQIPELLQEDLPPKLLKKFKTSVSWIGRSIDEKDSDIRIIYLSTALESILTTRSDRKKGETLAYRMMLLNSKVDEPFILPSKVLWIYELRSKIIHGSRLGIATQSEYHTLRKVAIETLIYSLGIIRKKEMKKHSQFINFLESSDKVSEVLAWLKEQDDKYSENIKDQLETNLEEN